MYLPGPPLRIPVLEGLIERTLQALRTTASGPSLLHTHTDSVAGVGGAGQPPAATGRSGDLPQDDGRPEAAQITMEQLVHDHADAVYRVALSVTKDPVLAEDVSQDALIKAWQSLPTYRGEAPLRHWILRITHNMSISTLRRRREEVVAPADLPERATSDRSVDVQVQERIAIDRFEATLADLDGVSRSIVVLREVEGLSYIEMSNMLELPLPTIRTRLLRARRQLAEALDGWQP
jgi:RNA polymerase sigma-70 factor, ECF subfamily